MQALKAGGTQTDEVDEWGDRRRMRDLAHLSLNTCHMRDSPRSEVGDDIIDMLRPLVRATGGPLPRLAGYVLGIDRDGRDAVYTISSVVGADDPEPVPLITCWLAVEHPARVWASVPSAVAGVEMPESTPWLAVLMHPTALLRPEALGWLGDAERCIAWALIEEDRRTQ